MNQSKVTDLDYINFLVATPHICRCTEAARVQPAGPRRAAHAALTRLLHRLEPDSTPLWHAVQQHVNLHAGILVVDDTTLDQPYAQHIGLVHRLWSGNQQRVVQGINVVTLLWTDGTHGLPVDYRFYDKPNDGATTHDQVHAMLATAAARGFRPEVVAVDSWYSSLPTLKVMRSYGWHWRTRLKCNRQVNPDRTGNRAVQDVVIPPTGRVVHLKGDGLINVFRIVTADGDTEYWATRKLGLDAAAREELEHQGWRSETYHRGLKQFCGAERSQVRAARAQRNHIGFAMRAFVRLEHHRIRTDTSWFEAKMGSIRRALQYYLSHTSPLLIGLVQSPATA